MGPATFRDFSEAFLEKSGDLPSDVLLDLGFLQAGGKVFKPAVAAPEGSEVGSGGDTHEPHGFHDGGVGDVVEGLLGRAFERPEGFRKSDVVHGRILSGALSARPIVGVVVAPSRRALTSSAGAFRDPRVCRRGGRDSGDPVGVPPLWVGKGRVRADLLEPVRERAAA